MKKNQKKILFLIIKFQLFSLIQIQTIRKNKRKKYRVKVDRRIVNWKINKKKMKNYFKM